MPVFDGPTMNLSVPCPGIDQYGFWPINLKCFKLSQSVYRVYLQPLSILDVCDLFVLNGGEALCLFNVEHYLTAPDDLAKRLALPQFAKMLGINCHAIDDETIVIEAHNCEPFFYEIGQHFNVDSFDVPRNFKEADVVANVKQYASQLDQQGQWSASKPILPFLKDCNLIFNTKDDHMQVAAETLDLRFPQKAFALILQYHIGGKLFASTKYEGPIPPNDMYSISFPPLSLIDNIWPANSTISISGKDTLVDADTVKVTILQSAPHWDSKHVSSNKCFIKYDSAAGDWRILN